MDKDKIKSEGNVLKQLLLEVLLTKFGTHSLEHLTRGIEKIKPLMLKLYKDNQDSQNVVLDTIFKVFNMDSLAAQDFEKENLFQLRQKVVDLVIRLHRTHILDSSMTISWCISKLEGYSSGNGMIHIYKTHCQVVLSLL